ncbi:hypothetical protein SPRG_18960 [Saprolegnia parasitica CBS 223.65]|uniref:Uncharacterized protein n=1 Tax=Saprolegnia parasitica (strain CBS 223.65) TaxID=695850 RepID=A0A067D8Y1_SAPPC|nr:hypothetical protein SPRG_18960 [Saprolegnia parasitica CBS 223.65]KDO35096.1 hypothetical protein SPRG_18960 [Saprolegnia parasitica CBS 223.65]|eukprot:XP_012194827.1 hypothetical protein SPRG_18960 [Saprolegnia parasitica CBS 223.65]
MHTYPTCRPRRLDIARLACPCCRCRPCHPVSRPHTPSRPTRAARPVARPAARLRLFCCCCCGTRSHTAVALSRSYCCCARSHAALVLILRSCARALRRCNPLLRPSRSTRAAAATSAARWRFSFSCLRCFVVALPA